MSPTTNKITHFLFSGFPAWGHVRSFCVLAARLVKEHDYMFVTIILAPNLLNKAHMEVSAELRGDATENIRRRIRVLSSFKSDSEDLFSLVPPLIQSYATSYQTLLEAKPISCAVSGETFEAIAAPNLVILDFFAHLQMLATRSITGNTVPIAAWVTGHAASIIRIFGPAKYGGHGDLGVKIEEEARRKGVTPQEIGDAVYNYTDGSIIKIPGIPDMHDWEYFPQKLAFNVPLSEVVKMAQSGLKECDTVIATTAYAFEKESIDGLKTWFSDWNKDVHIIGPLLPSGYGIVPESSRGSSETEEFLDRIHSEHGEKSVVVISFGTIFWPTAQEYIEEVIEALIEKKFAFIISHSSPYAKISDELNEKMKSSGLGLASKWFPQQFVLNHPATGWFITHAGHNSIMETLGSGIPTICWPFEADQPAAAAHMTENLNLSFELIEVRTGDNGLKPLYRNGRRAKGTREAVGVEIREILDACRSDKGNELHRNAQSMKAKFAEAWGEDGTSRKEIHDILGKYAS